MSHQCKFRYIAVIGVTDRESFVRFPKYALIVSEQDSWLIEGLISTILNCLALHSFGQIWFWKSDGRFRANNKIFVYVFQMAQFLFVYAISYLSIYNGSQYILGLIHPLLFFACIEAASSFEIYFICVRKSSNVSSTA